MKIHSSSYITNMPNPPFGAVDALSLLVLPGIPNCQPDLFFPRPDQMVRSRPVLGCDPHVDWHQDVNSV